MELKWLSLTRPETGDPMKVMANSTTMNTAIDAMIRAARTSSTIWRA